MDRVVFNNFPLLGRDLQSFPLEYQVGILWCTVIVHQHRIPFIDQRWRKITCKLSNVPSRDPVPSIRSRLSTNAHLGTAILTNCQIDVKKEKGKGAQFGVLPSV